MVIIASLSVTEFLIQLFTFVISVLSVIIISLKSTLKNKVDE